MELIPSEHFSGIHKTGFQDSIGEDDQRLSRDGFYNTTENLIQFQHGYFKNTENKKPSVLNCCRFIYRLRLKKL